MRKPIIEFKDFSVQYVVQEKPTVNNINLTIYEGEKVLILGPSGSGKSTLAHTINGLIPFSYDAKISGSLKIQGKETSDMSLFEISTKVGTVLQDPDSQFIGLTVGEDIAFKLENKCVELKEMKERVKDISKIVDLEDALTQAPHALSGGQKQRVTLGGTIIDDVDILLFDEPLASLDPKAGVSSMELIDKIGKMDGKTIIIIEHRLEDVLHANIDRIILLNEGTIIYDGSPNKLLKTNTLKENGIREPLYISALKYAGGDLEKATSLTSVNTLDSEDFVLNIKKWDSENKEDDKVEAKEALLEFRGVSFSYEKNKTIIDNMSFKINKGELISIVGKNGAGKSTISKLICGFYRPTKGDILLSGKKINNDTIKERANKIGLVMQNPNQMLSKTMIFDEVAFGLKVRGVEDEEIESRVTETLKVCGLYPYRNWPISALSYGQKKRVAIASILVLNPEIIILDEPTAGQDFKHYTEIMEFIKSLNKLGVTIIMITHDMHLMLEYTDRTLVVSKGRVLCSETPAEVLTNENLINEGNLKETSLYRLAINSGLQNPKGFVSKFIDYDRKVRN